MQLNIFGNNEQIEEGIYIVSAKSKETYYPQIQWLVISDIGISAYFGREEIRVQTRSLSSAKPLSNHKVSVIAKNNTILSEAYTGEDGFVSFSKGVFEDIDGNEAIAIKAEAIDKKLQLSNTTNVGKPPVNNVIDFNILDLSGPSFDLSDRGVGGREVKQELDALVYTERGLYRAGEKVHITAIIKNNLLKTQYNLPITIRLIRPDGEISLSRTISSGTEGAIYYPYQTASNAISGKWFVEAYLDKNKSPIGKSSFEIRDFVPPKVDINVLVSRNIENKDFSVDVKSEYYFGAIASGLKGEFSYFIEPAKNNFLGWQGYHFGNVDEEFEKLKNNGKIKPTDTNGEVNYEVVIPKINSSLPLNINLRTTIFEEGGRPVNSLNIEPLLLQDKIIGIKNLSGDFIKENSTAQFKIIFLDTEKNQVANQNLKWQLFKENYDYIWYQERYGGWKVKKVLTKTLPVSNGSIQISDNSPAELNLNSDNYGTYKLVVSSVDNKIFTSMRYGVGWQAESSKTISTPDKLKIKLDKSSYKKNDIMKLKVDSPYQGKGVVTVLTDKVEFYKEIEINDNNQTFEVPVKDWGVGAYVAVHLYKNNNNQNSANNLRNPARAIGLSWFKIEKSQIKVTIDLPETILPNTTLTVPVKVDSDNDNKKSFFTLALVDEGVLKLSGFKNANPENFYYGQRSLGVEFKDIYGKIILNSKGILAETRTGGDASIASAHLQGLKSRTTKVVSLFTGILQTDENGNANVEIDVPDFDGKLRAHIVAYNDDAVGSVEDILIVRSPVIANLSTPRFLAPSDIARLDLVLHNIEHKSKTYNLKVEGTSGLKLSYDDQDIKLDIGEKIIPLTLKALKSNGEEKISLSLNDSKGFNLNKTIDISIRDYNPLQNEVLIGQLKSKKTLSMSQDLLKNFKKKDSHLDITLTTSPNLNISEFLDRLDRYPYGCLEQTTSRVFPLLYINKLSNLYGLKVNTNTLDAQINKAIQRILNMQRTDGSFGLWSNLSKKEPWLSVYATHFLLAAKDLGYYVDDISLSRAVTSIKNDLNALGKYSSSLNKKINILSYGVYVLSEYSLLEFNDTVRYFIDEYSNRLHSSDILAITALRNAADNFGYQYNYLDNDFASFDGSNIVKLITNNTNADLLYRYFDYRTGIRELAAYLALDGKGISFKEKTKLLRLLINKSSENNYLSTQELSWIVLAINAISGSGKDIDISVDNLNVNNQNSFNFQKQYLELDKDIKITNKAEEDLNYTIVARGFPSNDLPSKFNGVTIKKNFYDLNGNIFDIANLPLKQGEVLFVHIFGEDIDKSHLNRRMLVVDLLPAGFEIESVAVGKGVNKEEFSNLLPELSDSFYQSNNDDRFISFVDFENYEFSQGYIVRAVTPGLYSVPPAYIEDMYQPSFFARGEVLETNVVKSQD